MEVLSTDNPVIRAYNYINYYLQDPRTAHLPFITSPITIILFTIVYNLCCLKLGPKFMEKRKPFELRKAIITFDLFQIIVNAYVFYKALTLGWLGRYNFFCAEIETEDTPVTREIALACYLYFIIKVSDVIDTTILVLRKKNQHISFLHMYHHSLMIITSFINAKYIPGGHHTCLGLYNSFVHSVMYSYYLWAALNPKANLLSFKKLVTKLQMVQFGIIIVHATLPMITPNCNYPSWPLFLMIPNNFLMLLLFYDFYRNTYILKKNRPIKTNQDSSKKTE